MDIKKQESQNQNLFLNSMGSMNGYSERSKLNPLDQKKVLTVAIFDDRSHSSSTENLSLVSDLSNQDRRISGTCDEKEFRIPNNGLVIILEGDKIYDIIKKRLVSSLSSCGFTAQVEAIMRKDYHEIMSRARYLSFNIFSRAMEIVCGGNGNIKYTWYGSSKNEIDDVLSYGFSHSMSTGTHGHGIALSAIDHPFESMQSLVADENGLRHMLLCRVILGRMDVIRPGMEQFNPSSEEFDSGVDDLVSPRKYVIWSSSMNTRILPEFLVSFRASASYCRGCHKIPQPPRVPNSDWISFKMLINTLSDFLAPDEIKWITKHHSDHKKRKITRHELVQRVRLIAGDKLLVAVIKSHRDKMKKQLTVTNEATECNNVSWFFY